MTNLTPARSTAEIINRLRLQVEALEKQAKNKTIREWQHAYSDLLSAQYDRDKIIDRLESELAALREENATLLARA